MLNINILIYMNIIIFKNAYILIYGKSIKNFNRRRVRGWEKKVRIW